ncbi:C2H2 type zinc-finger-domain-containing protein [Xylaria sp. FL1777]|nr:C2H2 type zinc-finger-domain-containing protein [Xylaria sp. FL1777]
MVVTTTTVTTSATSLPMGCLSPSPETDSTPTSVKEPLDFPDAAMQPFTPGQCLFCPRPSSSFPDSVVHMQKSHGLFIPRQKYLVVDLETLFKYLHLIIFGFQECIQCGTERTTVQAVQQHMTGKGHCKFDVLEQESEFAEFYNFSDVEEDIESEAEDDRVLGSQAEEAVIRKPQLADEDSIRLPSGKIISRQSSSAQAGQPFTHMRRRPRALASQLKYSLVEPNEDHEREEGSSKEKHGLVVLDKGLLSKREKRERATARHQMANLSANDRNSLMHLPISQQRSMLATQHRQAEKGQKEERRRQGKIDRKGNKNLYAYWHTETPVYQCG